MNINISPEDVDALVRDSILKAGLGKTIDTAVQKAFSGFDNPIDAAIKHYVAQVAGDILRTVYAAQVKDAIVKHIESKVTPELIDKVTSGAVEKMIRAAEDSRY